MRMGTCGVARFFTSPQVPYAMPDLVKSAMQTPSLHTSMLDTMLPMRLNHQRPFAAKQIIRVAFSVYLWSVNGDYQILAPSRMLPMPYESD